MPRRQAAIILVLFLGLAAAILFLLLTEPQPKYRGRPLSYWVMLQDIDSSAERRQAIDAIGTNGIPFLLKWMQYEPPKPNTGLSILRLLPWAKARQEKRERLADGSDSALWQLGTNAASAAPTLVSLLHDTNAPATAARAIRVLANIGNSGFAPLVSAIQDPHYPLRVYALNVFGVPRHFGSNAIPVLIQCLNDTNNTDIPLLASLALGKNQSAPELSITALEHCVITASDPYIRAGAMKSLSYYNELAKSALPVLTNGLTDADPRVREAATNAISQIAP